MSGLPSIDSPAKRKLVPSPVKATRQRELSNMKGNAPFALAQPQPPQQGQNKYVIMEEYAAFFSL